MKYRREIDGLRAVAVLPVILFHAGFSAFSGGFIGVDVFFVISGYLITTIILADKEKEKFSLVTFYERRARRILPALFFVMFCCIPFAWFWLLPNHLKDFSQSLIAVSAFSSNILFWRESGYFGTASELKPLLHTWSLAVEEQYYVLFPLFIMFMWKFSKRWIFGSLMVIAVASLAAAQWGAYNKPAATFFLLPTRGWELAIGALIAFYFLYKKDHIIFVTSNKAISEFFGFVGMILIGYSIFAFDNSTPFPSFYALLPTIGTALIIVFTTPQTLVGRFLGTKAMVGIGLISYSTYLWHQPLFVFARHRSLTEPSVSLLLTLSVLSIVMAYFSWRLVEVPFRDKKLINKKKLFIFAMASSLVFAALGLTGHLKNGFESRFSNKQLDLLAFNDYDTTKYFRTGSCFLGENENSPLFDSECYENVSEGSIVVWGDSYAAALSYGVRSFFKNTSQLTASKCPPLFGITTPNKGCYNINKFVWSLIKDKRPGVLLLHANWMGLGRWKSDTLQNVIATIQEIKRISPQSRIIIVGGMPQWPGSLPTLLHDKLIQMDSTYSMEPIKKTYDDNIMIDKQFETISNIYDVDFVSLTNMLCDDGLCEAVLPTGNGYTLMSFDYGHLTADASLIVAGKMLNKLNSSSQSK